MQCVDGAELEARAFLRCDEVCREIVVEDFGIGVPGMMGPKERHRDSG